MEILLGLLIILLIASLGYITTTTLKHYKEIAYKNSMLDALELDLKQMTKQWEESSNKVVDKCLLIDNLNARIIELNGECEELHNKLTRFVESTPEDVFENKFKKLVEDSDPRAKERLEQMSKCIFYSSELEDKVNTRGN